MPIWTVVYSLAFWPLLAIVCALGIARRKPPVRQAAAAMLVAMILGKAAQSSVAYARLELGLATVDLVFLIVLTWLSIRWERRWLIAMAALQLLMTLGHLARWWNPSASRLTYAILTGGGAYLQLAALAIALATERTRPASRLRDATADDIDPR